MTDLIDAIAAQLNGSAFTYATTGEGLGAEDEAQAIIDLIIARIPPLVWSGSSANFAYCTLPFAQYQVREAESGYYVQVDGYMSQVVSDKHDTIDEAKAAANAHHVAQLCKGMGIE